MSLDKIETGKSLINFFYALYQPAFNFLYPFPLFLFFLFIILLDILPANSLLFKGISIQLNTLKVNNIFFILIPATYICL